MSEENETAKMATEEFVTEYVAEYSDEHEIQPYSGTPKKDGVASAGNASTGFACGDHVHPTDTSRLAVETFNTEISNLRNSFFDNVSYDENSKKILFKNGNTVLKELPATQFIKDGMVSSVAISNEKLVISFNTDAGKEDIQIPLTDIFNPSNYYAKTAADGRFVQKEAGKGLVAVDATMKTQGDAADAKAVGDALRSGFTQWVFSDGLGHSMSIEEYDGVWRYSLDGFIDSMEAFASDTDALAALSLTFVGDNTITVTRHLITPTKTSQLTNDGDGSAPNTAFVLSNDPRLSNARTPTAHTHAMADVTGLNAALAQKANASDLHYALVEPVKWEYSGVPSGTTVDDMEFLSGNWVLTVTTEGSGQDVYYSSGNQSDLMVEFVTVDGTVTATRAFLPGHLCDRAGNLVVVSGDTTLTLPAAVSGYCRDFLVRLEISGSTVPTITFQGQGSEAPNGADEITYETDGDEFPVPDEAGDWLYSFTESCVAHKFAVSLKKVNEVAQGGA